MSGKIIAGLIVMISLIAGAAIYYLQVYAFYQTVEATPGQDVELVSIVTDLPEPIAYDDFEAIDADSSPIRYRACFTTPHSHAMLTETYVMLDGVEPRNGPEWFDCFDATAIAEALEDGTALAFLSHKNIAYGVDRIVVITEDGRGYAWHDLNDCGEKAYDGSVIGEECPPKPEAE